MSNSANRASVGKPPVIGVFVIMCFSTLIAACAGNSVPTVDPIYRYRGDAPQVRLQTLDLEMENGTKVAFTGIFAGYAPAGGVFALTFPSRRNDFDIALVPNRRYQTLFRSYDANDNDFLEKPEMTVMYVQEAARGLGHPAVGLHAGSTVRALNVPRADIGGLLSFINRNASRMSPRARALFNDMHWIVEEIRSSQEGGHMRAN